MIHGGSSSIYLSPSLSYYPCRPPPQYSKRARPTPMSRSLYPCVAWGKGHIARRETAYCVQGKKRNSKDDGRVEKRGRGERDRAIHTIIIDYGWLIKFVRGLSGIIPHPLFVDITTTTNHHNTKLKRNFSSCTNVIYICFTMSFLFFFFFNNEISIHYTNKRTNNNAIGYSLTKVCTNKQMNRVND